MWLSSQFKVKNFDSNRVVCPLFYRHWFQRQEKEWEWHSKLTASLKNQLELVMTCLVLVNLTRNQSVNSSCDWFLHLFFQLFVLQVILVRPVPVLFSSGEYHFYGHLKFDPKTTLKYSSLTFYNNQLFHSRAGHCPI